MTSVKQWLLFCFFILSAGLFAVGFGQDLNYDLLQYHFYNGYAFLHQRLTIDVGAGMIQTYLNPFFDVINYLLISLQQPRLVEFLFGAIAGAGGFLLYLIAKLFFANFSVRRQQGYTWVALAIGLSGATSITLINTTTNDTKMALLVLLAMYWLIQAAYVSRQFSYRYFILSALCAGLVTGLKLTAATYVVSLFIAFFLLGSLKREHWQQCGIYIIFMMLGFLIANGHWMYVLYQQFHNPFFPYFNNIFHSPFAPFSSFNVPPTQVALPFYQYVFFFWYVAVDARVAAEVALRDPHLLVLVILSCMALAKYAYQRYVKKSNAKMKVTNPVINFIITFFVVSYLLWVMIFAVYRYMLPLEWLSGILIVYVTTLIISSPRHQFYFLTTLFFALIFMTQYPDWGNRHQYHVAYLDVGMPAMPANATVLLGTVPLAYVIPFFPNTIHFIGMPFIMLGVSEVTPEQINKRRLLGETMQALTRNDKPIYMLSFAEGDRFVLKSQKILNYFGMQYQSSHCQWLTTNIEGKHERLKLCRVLHNTVI